MRLYIELIGFALVIYLATLLASFRSRITRQRRAITSLIEVNVRMRNRLRQIDPNHMYDPD